MSTLVIFTLFGLVLSWIDLSEYRLPNQLIIWVSLTSFSSAIFTYSNSEVMSALIIMVYFGLAFIFLFLFSKGTLGFGDVKYAVPCGFVIGILDPTKWLMCIWLMFTMAAIYGIGKVLCCRATLSKAIPFGPFMTLAVVVIGFNSL